MKTDIIVICGPTGIGKTGVAIALANRFSGEIVGADSMQIYRYLDIGTAKPSAAERLAAPHHLIDCVDPATPFDAARYVDSADGIIRGISRRGRLPVVAGGTGLYVRALVHGLFRGCMTDERDIRRLEAEAEQMGALILHDRLSVADPVAAARIHPHDRFRLVRALAVLERTGRPITHFHQAHGFAPRRYNALKIGLAMDREALYHRINRRVDLMIRAGLVQEVRDLIERGYGCHLKAMQSIGYRHVCEYLGGAIGHEEMVTLMKRDTRRYAKRQLTWFKKENEIVWVDPRDLETANHLVARFLEGTAPDRVKGK